MNPYRRHAIDGITSIYRSRCLHARIDDDYEYKRLLVDL